MLMVSRGFWLRGSLREAPLPQYVRRIFGRVAIWDVSPTAGKKKRTRPMETIMSDFASMPVARNFHGGNFSRRVGRALRNCWLAYLDWRLQLLALKQLRGMSDRELKDMGVTRSQIEFQFRSRPSGHATLTPHPF
jgi:uncharacterized protein YjiS (DUF1127 family)